MGVPQNLEEWLLDSDPAVRWQLLADLTDASTVEVAAERARVATEGWGARLLALRDEDGQWAARLALGEVATTEPVRQTVALVCVLDGLLAYEQATGGTAETIAARGRGEEYLLQRRLSRTLSTGEFVDAEWLQFAFPTQWHYDVLRGLDHFRAVGGEPDPRLDEAVELVRRKQQADGTWLLDTTHRGEVHFVMEDGEGRPSRWNTLRALRVLRWYDRS